MADSLFSIGGLASGLDTNGIIDALMNVSRLPVTKMQEEKVMLGYKQQMYNDLSVQLIGLQAQAASLADSNFFTSRNATTTSSSVVTATAEPGALQTTYTMNVSQMASSTTRKGSLNVTSSSAVSAGGGITTENGFGAANFSTLPQGTVTIEMKSGGSQVFDLSSYSSVDDFMWDVNHDPNIDVRLDYDRDRDRFSLFSKTSDGFTISENGGGGTGFFTAAGFFKQKSSSESVTAGGGIDVTKSFSAAGFDKAIDGSITINGKTFDPTSYATVNQFMNAVNADTTAKVTLSYDAGTDKFTLASDQLGERLSVSQSGSNPFFTEINISPDYINGINPNLDLAETSMNIPVADDSTFRINGIEFTVDVDVDALNDIIQDINKSDAGVIAFYDVSTDTLALQNKDSGAKSISLQDVKGNFLEAFKIIRSDDEFVSEKQVVSGAGVLNTADTWAAAGFDTVPDGTILINGNEFRLSDYVTVDDFMNAVNTSPDVDVNLSYDNVKDKFTITSGSAANIELAETGTNGFFSMAKIDVVNNGIGVEEIGTDAEFTLNGTSMTRQENSFIMNGTTFDLNGVGAATIKVANDNDTIITSVKSFVEQYNSVVDYIRTKLTETPVDDPATEEELKMGLLNGDSTLREIQNELRNMVSGTISDFANTENDLQDIGVSSGPIGTSIDVIALGHLFVDQSRLNEALLNDADMVANIFAKNWVSVNGEELSGVKDGANKKFTVTNKPVSFDMNPVIRINDGSPLKPVFGSTTIPGAGQYKLNYATGEIELGDAPLGGDSLTIDYKYTVNNGSRSGIATRLVDKLKSITKVNTGLIDTQIKTIESRDGDLQESIANLEYRLELQRLQLVTKYSAMEEAVSEMQSQGNYLTSQLQSINNSKS